MDRLDSLSALLGASLAFFVIILVHWMFFMGIMGPEPGTKELSMALSSYERMCAADKINAIARMEEYAAEAVRADRAKLLQDVRAERSDLNVDYGALLFGVQADEASLETTNGR